jgi:hypothetical protein
MNTIRITGWKAGLRKISLTKLLQQQGLSLGDAKRIVDDILDGREVLLTLSRSSDASAVVTVIRDLGD